MCASVRESVCSCVYHQKHIHQLHHLIIIDVHERVTAGLNLGEDATGRFKWIRSSSGSRDDGTRHVGVVEMAQSLLRLLNDHVNGRFAIIRGTNVLVPSLIALQWRMVEKVT